jgi:predicted transcriptional regulator
VAVAGELRKPVYMCVAWHALDLRQLLAQMSKVNWEVRDVMSQHSPYVDTVLRVSLCNHLLLKSPLIMFAMNLGVADIQHEVDRNR